MKAMMKVVLKVRVGVAMADENWFFGRGARKIIFEGRGPSGDKEIPRQARNDKVGEVRNGKGLE